MPQCPECFAEISRYRNPVPTVDIIIEYPCGDDHEHRIVLIRRKNPPYGWAIPGGFIDYGEVAEDAAVREAREETGLTVSISSLLGVYSDPERDPRHHTISIIFTGKGEGILRAGDDAGEAELFTLQDLPEDLAFDHGKILADYINTQVPKPKFDNKK